MGYDIDVDPDPDFPVRENGFVWALVDGPVVTEGSLD